MSHQPLAATTQSSTMPVAAQIGLATTVLVTSVSSTLLLQAVTHPYIAHLHEVITKGDISTDNNGDDRKFIATRYNWFGNQIVTEFKLSETSQEVSNPFATFKVKRDGSAFYLFGGSIEDLKIRSKFGTKID
jgi:hypothetical protein